MEHSKLVSFISCLTYSISGGLVVGDVLHWINANVGFCGLLLGLLTYITNTSIAIYYKNKEHKLAVAGKIDRRTE